MKKVNLTISVIAGMGLVFLSCNKEMKEENSSTLSQSRSRSTSGMGPGEGVVFTMSNSTAQNSILAYQQSSNGTLSLIGETASGGTGTGASLPSQGALVHNYPETWLFAVNAGSNSVSSFHIHSDGSLSLISTVSSGGTMPVSLAIYNDWLYVVNAGTSTISGFNVNFDGTLTPIANSTQPLSAANAAPGQISFTPGGKALLVTEKATKKISAFAVDAQGKADKPQVFSTTGQAIGLSFVRGNSSGIDFLLLPEAMQAESRLGIYNINGTGVVTFSQQSIATHQAGAGWVATTKDGFNSYVVNSGSNAISVVKAGDNGSISLQHEVATTTDAQPQDLALSGNEKYIYNISKGAHSLTGYKRMNNEALSRLSSVNLPDAASGLATVNKMFY